MAAFGIAIFFVASWMHAAYNVNRIIELGNSLFHLVSLSVDIAFIIILTLLLYGLMRETINKLCK